MIVYRQWQVYGNGELRYNVRGWYLFGLIPIYIKIHYFEKHTA